MCLADATGEWVDLITEVHRRYPRPTVAWVRARYARHLALSGDGPGAQENYLEAIERASVEAMFDDAAGWLYALRTVRSWYDDSWGDEQHPRAQALVPHAKPSALPGGPHTTELALRAILDESKLHEGLQRATRWRWQSFVRGELTDELAAVKSIGAVQQRLGDTDAAIESYVRAGSEKQAAAAAQTLSKPTARVNPRLLTEVPIQRPRRMRLPSPLSIFSTITWPPSGLGKHSLRSPTTSPLNGRVEHRLTCGRWICSPRVVNFWLSARRMRCSNASSRSSIVQPTGTSRRMRLSPRSSCRLRCIAKTSCPCCVGRSLPTSAWPSPYLVELTFSGNIRTGSRKISSHSRPRVCKHALRLSALAPIQLPPAAWRNEKSIRLLRHVSVSPIR